MTLRLVFLLLVPLLYTVTIIVASSQHGDDNPLLLLPVYNNATMILPLHEVSGSQHVTIYTGQPAVPKVLIVDTGSRLAAWTCSSPDNKKQDQTTITLIASSSTTLQRSHCGACVYPGSYCNNNHDYYCEWHQKYTEGSSWTANEVTDFVSLLPVISIDDGGGGTTMTMTHEDAWHQTTLVYRFGCQTQLTGLFQKQTHANGILGLERSEQSIVYNMYRQGLIASNSFSLCLTHGGGYMGLGGALSAKHLEKMAFTPIVRANGLYVVRVEEIWIGRRCLLCGDTKMWNAFNSGSGTVLDSGTTDTFLPIAAHDDFARIWEEETGLSFSKKRIKRYSYDDFLKLPDIRYLFANNVTLQVSPGTYMEGAQLSSSLSSEQWTGTRELSNRIYVNEPEGAVLGLNMQREYDILYESERVGFAKADCRVQQSVNSDATTVSIE
jgi:hypothetical protein